MAMVKHHTNGLAQSTIALSISAVLVLFWI
jgi:hypothetical protein